MANTQSAKKRARQTPKRTLRNTAIKASVRTVSKAARTQIAEAPKTATASVRLAVSKLAKAGKKGVVHRRNAARKISRLMKAAAKAKVSV